MWNRSSSIRANSDIYKMRLRGDRCRIYSGLLAFSREFKKMYITVKYAIYLYKNKNRHLSKMATKTTK